MHGPGRTDAGPGGDPVKRSSGPQRHKPLLGSRDTHLAWQRRTRDAAIERARETRPSRPVHTPTKVVDLIIARSNRMALEALGLAPLPRGRCEVCGRPATNTHTRRPDGMGGTNRPETYLAGNKIRVNGHGNVTGCHALIENERPWAKERGLLLPQATKDPASKPVELLIGRVLLDNLGGFEPATNTHHRWTAA